MYDAFSYQALPQLFGLYQPIFGKRWIVGALCGVKPFRVYKVEAVSVSCNPDGLGHKFELSIITYQM
jgi:hypothetical protein